MNVYNAHPVQARDYADWQPLFAGYADFYGKPALDSTVLDTVWQWLGDPSYALAGLLLRTGDGQAVGLAHIRAYPHTLTGRSIGFLDDLYIHVDHRGQGAADALFLAIRELASQQGWAGVRWLTQHFNARARAFYDRHTNGPSDFIAYHWAFDAMP